MTRKFEGADQESLDLLKKMKDRVMKSCPDIITQNLEDPINLIVS